MARDAGTAGSPNYEDLVPPISPARVLNISLIGLGFVAVACGLGLISGEGWINTIRLWAAGIGLVLCGYAVSLRAALPQLWLLAALQFFLAGFVGVPKSWDSAQFMLRVLGGVALAGAGIAALPYLWRLRVASWLILIHFFGIFLATTSPSTQAGTSPFWITEQVFNKVYMHYLQFVYLRNAYHFYSPEPGPASLVAFLLETKVGKEVVDGEERDKIERRWVVIPRRPQDIKDPLGVSYFRRLSITEQVAAPGNPSVTSESSEIYQRRTMAFYKELQGRGRVVEERIPLNPYEPVDSQYRMPSLITYRYLLPSYAQHVIHDEVEKDKMAQTTVKIYQLVHRTMSVHEARSGVAPYAPGSYLAYYLGEYNVFGDLVDPRDPMLYWLVPVYAKQPGFFTDASPDKFEDYLSRHAGLPFDWSALR